MTAGVIDIPSPSGPTVETAGKIHVAHVIEALGPGGAERLLYTNLKHLDSSRFRNTVITIFSRANHWREPIEALGVDVVSLNCRGTRDLPSAVNALQKWLRQNRPDVIHTHLWAANVVGRIAGRLAGIPVISSAHNPDYEPEARDDGSDVSSRKRNLARAIDRWTGQFGSRRMIAVSDYVRQSTHRHLRYPIERIDLLYNPIDAESFTNYTGRSREQALQELGIPADSFVLLNVARISPQKGQLYAVRALPLIAKKYPNVHLILTGATTDSQCLAQVQEEIRSLGVADKVHILGARTDIPDLLHACDIFVFPSLYEGLGIALIEAMAAGCTCIATQTGPLAEVVTDGVDGMLVPPRDEKQLAATVCDLIADPARRKSLASAARKSALERFDPQTAAKRLMEIYESLVRK